MRYRYENTKQLLIYQYNKFLFKNYISLFFFRKRFVIKNIIKIIKLFINKQNIEN